MLYLHLFFSWLALGQPTQEPISWTFYAVPYSDGYLARLAPLSQSSASVAFVLPTIVRFAGKPCLTFLGRTVEMGTVQWAGEEVLGTNVNRYADRIQFTQTVVCKVGPVSTVCGTIIYQACTAERCLPPQTIPVSIPLT